MEISFEVLSRIDCGRAELPSTMNLAVESHACEMKLLGLDVEH